MIWLIIIFGLGLRLISLNQPFWLDEATTGVVVRDLTLSQIFNEFLPGDFHPPLYYLLVRGWGYFFGTGEIALRMPSVLAGIGTVYVVYLISKELKLKSVEAAALLLATSGLHIYFSQEARMYALASLFVSLSVYFFVKTLREGGVGEWIGFSVFLTAATLTHYLTIFMLPVFWVFGIWAGRDRPWWEKFLMSHNILVVSWLLWLPTFIKQLQGGVNIAGTSPLWASILGKTTFREVFLVPTKFILGRISIDNKLLYGFVVICAGILFGYMLILAIKRYKSTKLLALWLGLPVALAAILGVFVPVFSYFRLLFVLPAFYILTAVGVDSLQKDLRRLAFVLVLSVNITSSAIYLFNPRFHRENWRGLVQFVESQELSSIILFPADSQMEALRYYSSGIEFGGPDKLSENFDTIWLMRYVQEIFDPEDKLRRDIESLGYNKSAEYNFNGVVVWRYER